MGRSDVSEAAFTAWMAEVDKHILNAVGMDHNDLPDWRYRDAFEEGMAPVKAAKRAVKAAEGF